MRRQVETVLDAIRAGNWDVYREEYPDLSMQDKAMLHNVWDAMFSQQKHYNAKAIERVFNLLVADPDRMSVVELGCHQGHLAEAMLARFITIESWTGYDLNYSALNRSIVKDRRYVRLSILDGFDMIPLPSFNVFVSTHTLEHLSASEVKKTMSHVSGAKYLILEIPISEHGQDWKGYQGAHVLTAGRVDIRKIIEGLGYEAFSEINGGSWLTAWKKVA